MWLHLVFIVGLTSVNAAPVQPTTFTLTYNSPTSVTLRFFGGNELDLSNNGDAVKLVASDDGVAGDCSSTAILENTNLGPNDSTSASVAEADFTILESGSLKACYKLKGGNYALVTLSEDAAAGVGSSCADGVKNGDEEGVDCGGSCDVCAADVMEWTLIGGGALVALMLIVCVLFLWLWVLKSGGGVEIGTRVFKRSKQWRDGDAVMARWRDDPGWHPGTIAGFDRTLGKYHIEFDDGDEDWQPESGLRHKTLKERCDKDHDGVISASELADGIAAINAEEVRHAREDAKDAARGLTDETKSEDDGAQVAVPVSVAKSTFTYPPGCQVQARYIDKAEGPSTEWGTKWYTGKIVAANDDGTFEVEFHDGDKHEAVPSTHVRMCVGTRVHISGGKDGKISKLYTGGKRCDVVLDSGETVERVKMRKCQPLSGGRALGTSPRASDRKKKKKTKKTIVDGGTGSEKSVGHEDGSKRKKKKKKKKAKDRLGTSAD
jgi:hypothetical protein